MKKFISIALVVLMVLSVIPVTAFAAGTASVTIKDSTGNTPAAAASITDIKAAFDWVYTQENSAEYTIYLNGDITTADMMAPLSYDNTNVRTIKVEGNGYTLTCTNGTAMFYGIGLYNLQLSNINLEAQCLNPLDWSPRLSTGDNYNNYDIGVAGVAGTNKAMVDSYAVFTKVKFTPIAGTKSGTIKLKGGNTGDLKATYHITMTDCEFTCNTGDTMFMQNCGSHLDLKLIGTKLTHTGGVSNNQANNHMFQMNSPESSVTVENSANNVSVITSAQTGGHNYAGIWHPNNSAGKFTFTFGKGVQLVLASTKSNNNDFIMYGTGNITVVDNGAEWIAKKELLTAGKNVVLPALTSDVAWSGNGTDVDLATQTYANAAATADVKFTHTTAGEQQLIASSSLYLQTSDGNKEYFTTLTAAINKLGILYSAVTAENLTDDALWQAAGSPTIYVYKDITQNSTIEPSWWNSGYNAARVRTVVIKGVATNGKNPVITSNASGAFLRYMSYYNFTMENIDLDCNGGFALFWSGYSGGKNSGKSTVNIVNCNIWATGTSGEGLVFKVTGNQDVNKMTEDYTINLVNTNVVGEAGVNAVFLFHHGAAGTLNIDGNSSITHTNAHSADGGDTIFMIGTNRKLTINIESGAELTSYAKVTKQSVYSLIRTENSNTYPSPDGIKNVINIKSGAKLTINADDSFEKPVVFINQLTSVSNGNTYVNVEEGVTFSVNAKAAELGFTTITTTNPYLTNDAEKSLLGWNGVDAEGETTFYASGAFAAGAVTGAVTVTPVFYSEDDFVMLQGAGYKEGGILFGFEVTDALISSFGEDAVYGIMIAPTEYTKWGFNKDMLSQSQRIEITTDATGLTDGNGVQYCYLGFDGIPTDNEDAVSVELCAIGFIEYKNAGGSTVTIYTANTYAISYAQLAAAAAK